MPSIAERLTEAVSALGSKDHKRTLSLCDELFGHGAVAVDALVELANACRAAGDQELAQHCFDKVLELAPNNPLGRIGKALVLEDVGNPDGAIVALRAAVSVAPNSLLALNNLGAVLIDNARAREALDVLKHAVQLDPNDFAAQHNLGRVYSELGRRDEAIATYDAALAIQPASLDTRAARRELLAQAVPQWHFPMMNDHRRNNAYDRALAKAVQPGMHVLDIGTGAGLLSMMAIRAGAGRVTTCEAVPAIAERARRVFAHNGLATDIDTHALFSTDLEIGAHMPARADLLVAEILGAEVLRENVLSTLRHARDELLVPGAQMIPKAAATIIAPLCSLSLEQHVRVEDAAGFDLRPFNDCAPKRFYTHLYMFPHELLGPPTQVFRVDFAQDTNPETTRTLKLVCTAAGRCLGIAQWLKIDLDDEVTHENHPDIHAVSSWKHVVYPFESTVDLEVGDTLHILAAQTKRTLDFHLVHVTRKA